MTWGAVVIGVSTAVYVVGLFGMRTGRRVGAWSVVLAAAAAGVASGGVLVQTEPGAASWVLAPTSGAVVGVVHARALFAAGGPFRI